MSSALGRVAVVAAGIFLVLVALLLALLPGQQEKESASSFSTEPDGWRALYLLCERLGFPVGTWSAAPAGLEGAGTLLVLRAVPEAPPGTRPSAGTGPRSARDPAHYRSFLEQGGTMLLLTDVASDLARLRDTFGLVELSGLEAERHARGALTLELDGGESVELEPGACLAWSGAGLEVLARARLAPAQEGAPTSAPEPGESEQVESVPEPTLAPAPGVPADLIVRVAVGRGALVLVGLEPELFGNRALEQEAQPALLFVRLLERCGTPARVLFDEYALGAFEPPSRLELLFSPALAAASLHLVAWFALFFLAAAWVGPFARDPEPLLAAAPLARARGNGAWLARARRFDLLAELLRTGLRERWNARAGQRTLGAEADLVALARGDERWLARARGLFLGAPPADAAELQGLARGLAQLERELFTPTDTSSRAGRRPRRTPNRPS